MYERFALLLAENNVTPYRVSKDTGIATATLSDWKNGRSTPKNDKLQKIADYFNVSLDWLTGNSDYRNVQDLIKSESNDNGYLAFSKLLNEKGVTAYKVSKETGVTQSTLSDWKRGRSTPKTDNMKKIADYFGVSIDYLMTGKDSTPEENPIDLDYAKNETERKLLVLCRKANDVSEEEREDIINLFENTIDLYLKAKGIKGDE
ncbi:MAG: hypothetical protein EUB_02297 [Eubacterium sp.]|uniref:helix-turn-helix transcriptional regulator n=1 Tax=Eubacterium sp. TaxID=142586 RepID=UPI00303747D0